MKIQLNSDNGVVESVKEALRANDGFCPCSIVKNVDTKCMCKEFRENKHMKECHCGLYVRC